VSDEELFIKLVTILIIIFRNYFSN